MKRMGPIKYVILAVVLIAGSCSQLDPLEVEVDQVPKTFLDIKLNPDEIYIYPSELGSRLDPLLNDSIKVQVTISYATPNSGTISFIPNEGWFYKANDGFYGSDVFDYTVCHNDQCVTSTITMHVEVPRTGADCYYELNGESIVTKKDQPIEIRIFANDVVCPYMGSSVTKPDKGTYNVYSYSGNIKNTVIVYYPPQGYVGADRIRYKIFTDGPDMIADCLITVTD